MRGIRVLFVLALVALALLAWPAVEAKTCLTRNNNTAWHHGRGLFRRPSSADKTWFEYDEHHKEQAKFVEIMRETQQVVLEDSTRGVQILLRDGICGVKSDGEQTFRQLYQGSFMRIVDCT